MQKLWEYGDSRGSRFIDIRDPQVDGILSHRKQVLILAKMYQGCYWPGEARLQDLISNTICQGITIISQHVTSQRLFSQLVDFYPIEA